MIRQYSRWAEGHTRTFRKYFWKILRNKKVSLKEKLDFILTGYCFLHTVMVTILMFALLVVIIYPRSTFPFFLNQVQTFLLFSSIPAAISASITALILEDSKEDIKKFVYAWILNFFLTPIMAYAALKGFCTKNGKFNRIYKTGKIILKKC